MLKKMIAGGMIGLAAVLALSLPPSNAGDPKDKDIVETAVAAGKFKTLATALEAAGLIDTLKGKGPFTVFAPTDEAFAKLPRATVEALLKDKQRLTTLLTYPVAAKTVTSAEIAKFETATLRSVEGTPIAIKTASEDWARIGGLGTFRLTGRNLECPLLSICYPFAYNVPRPHSPQKNQKRG